MCCRKGSVLAEYDAELAEEGLLPETHVGPGSGAQGSSGSVFLRLVVQRLLDTDQDGFVTRSELHHLHLMATGGAHGPA